ncbi:ABC transporter permease [Paeniglutamicibacter terrestris]|uniref:ABC transporter permease n=1 Tax=Paeniglutamicibacter terrestris TaxID=2723403 RepID=A0ABX1G447_9MICC|nr:ABC transporter permease [Paeniglutamicibacter terrestris]ASN40626.1 branched-chain amino acid ABC transporter permease [Arthrobacter sp. 7749]NKG21018.1 ABC transporter permease [Paeniglutamicibacter terrestris]
MTITQQPQKNLPAPRSETRELSPVTVPRRWRSLAPRLIAPVALAAILLGFSLLSPVFLSVGNLVGVLGQMAILALVATGLTVVVRAGGIDLSIGVAVDLAALASAALIADGYRAWVAIVVGLFFGLLVGVVNAALIVGLRIPPFLATLSVWFIGSSVQQLLTGGGAPIYLSKPRVPIEFALLGRGYLLDVDGVIVSAALVALFIGALLGTTRWGRSVTVTGEQPTAARISGLRINRITVSAYLLCSLVGGFAGVILASRTNGFVPGSGQAYLMDAIGAVFIGATLSRFSRVSVPGTLMGVLIFGLLSNGMNLVGLSFFWQGLGRGVVLLAILLLGVLLSRNLPSGTGILTRLFTRPAARSTARTTT